MRTAHLVLALALLLAFGGGSADAYVYRTARGLYKDCSQGEAARTEQSMRRYRNCADFIDRIFNNWNLNQDNGVCSRHVGAELPEAYVTYWRAKGLSFLSGTLTSAVTSVNEFLDSQKQPCPMPDPKTNPP